MSPVAVSEALAARPRANHVAAAVDVPADRANARRFEGAILSFLASRQSGSSAACAGRLSVPAVNHPKEERWRPEVGGCRAEHPAPPNNPCRLAGTGFRPTHRSPPRRTSALEAVAVYLRISASKGVAEDGDDGCVSVVGILSGTVHDEIAERHRLKSEQRTGHAAVVLAGELGHRMGRASHAWRAATRCSEAVVPCA